MTRKSRTILFLLCFLVFLLVAPSMALYSQGYRIDFNPPEGGKMVTQTGGLFLKISPKQVEIYLEEKLKKKTDFLFGSALIENLIPKKYKVTVKKDGYHFWEKNLEIREKEVTEVKNIILFPEDLKFNILAKSIKKLWLSPDQTKMIFKEEVPPETERETSWALKLYEADKKVKSHLIEEKEISKFGAELLDLSFSEDSKEIFLKIGTEEQIKYFLINLGIFPYQLIKTESPPSSPKNIVASQTVNGNFYYLNNLGYLFKNNQRINEKSFPIGQETEYSLNIFSDFLFLKENKNLFKFNAEKSAFENFSEGINNLVASPDNQKLVYFSDSEIWLFFLEKDIENDKKSGDNLFLIRLSEKIGKVLWLNPYYLIFSSGDKIKIIETDTRDKINIINIEELKNPEIFWDEINKRLYILSEGNLYGSERLIQ